MKTHVSSNDLLEAEYYLTDGGLETDLIFNHDIRLPHFASFHVLNNPKNQILLNDYFKPYMDLAKQYGTGYILESTTWRAQFDWGYKLGYSPKELVKANQTSVDQMKLLKKQYEKDISHILISGCIGPRYDGYVANTMDNRDDARIYHSPQIKTLKDCGVDMVSGMTMTNVEEALGVVLAAKDLKVPVVISFTVEVDGSLPDGKSLQEAISEIDQVSYDYPSYYMINCAHPQHFEKRLRKLGEFSRRIQGIRANASCKSHAELDESTELDAGNREELGKWYSLLKNQHGELKIFGGCCGTDISHLQEICKHLFEKKSHRFV